MQTATKRASAKKVAEWTGTQWQLQTVDHEHSTGGFTSLALDSEDHPHISYIEQLGWDPTVSQYLCQLKYAHWNGRRWSIEVVDDDHCAGVYTAIAVDSHGHPHIAYYQMVHLGFFLKYARWTGQEWDLDTVASLSDTGYGIDMAPDAGDRAHIAHWSSSPDWALYYARSTGPGEWDTQIIDRVGEDSEGVSLVLDTIGRPHIAYNDQKHKDPTCAVGPPLAAVASDLP